ncbi:MAG: DNA internalization-related competence protein ComEC/Rec2, partial [Burkholderiaceae bacterium]
AAAARGMLREQWVVTIALTPLGLILFGQVSLVGMLANALAIPWVTLLVTPLAMAGVFYAPLWDFAAAAISLLALFLEWLMRWPWVTLSLPQAPLWAGLCAVAGAALLALRLPWVLRGAGVPLLVPLLFWPVPRPDPGQFELLAADVGQGNAVLLRTANHALLYDAGPRFSRESDAGHRVLVPLLRALGVHLDVLMLSHRDSDHSGGAAAVLATQRQAYLSSSIEDEHELQQLRPAVRCVAGQRWIWDGVDFQVLHPQAEDYQSRSRPNALSCVLRVASQTLPGRAPRVALLVGDIERPQELRLLARGTDVHADLLLVPHHGSKTSSSAEFLQAVAPRFAVVQAGYRNRFGHPASGVLERYREGNITVVDSPHCGALRWRSDSPSLVRCERSESRRYWHHVAP